MPAPNIETIVSLAKRRGFVFPSSEVYGGLGSAWDYGPLGVELCNNVKQAWWRWLVYDRDDIEGVDSSIILNRLVWKYSGHEATFNDWKGTVKGSRIDYILHTKDWEPLAADIVRTSYEGFWPSDHYPVTAKLRLRESP